MAVFKISIKLMFKSPFYQYLKETYRFASDYFLRSEERWKALLMLTGTIFCIIGIVVLTAYFSWWWVIFWGAFQAHNLVALYTSLKIFAVMTIAYVALQASFNYLSACLKLNWRRWLTQKICNEYLENSIDFLELSRLSPELANPSQRIQEDIDYFVDLSIDLSSNFFKSSLMQVAFIISLWILSQTLPLTVLGVQIFIPGYLVWIALIVAISATLIKQKIGASVKQLNDDQATNEARFRSELERIPQDAESIAVEHGQNYFKQSLNQKYQAIYNNTYEKIKIRAQLSVFDTFFQQLTSVLPYLAAAPLYFTNAIALGQLMQIGYSYAEVNDAFSWFMNCYDEMAWHQTNTKRLQELQKTLNLMQLSSTSLSIHRNHGVSSHAIIIEDLSLKNPQGDKTIISDFNINIYQKQHTFFSGPSGMGKSTLFKAIAGTWKYGKGEINLPPEDQISFLAQKSTFPRATLREILAYPKSVNRYTESQYEQVLNQVSMSHLISKLNEEHEWGKLLSGGQQQKIAFARVLLLKPQWLFLDESTSNMDHDSEAQMYSLIKKELPDTTFISISHKSSVEKFHTKTLFFQATEDGHLSLSSSPVNQHEVISSKTDSLSDFQSVSV